MGPRSSRPLGLLAASLVLAGCMAPQPLRQGLPAEPEPGLTPQARASAQPTEALPGDPVLFDANQSRDPDGRIASYQWDFGDGSGAQGPDKARVVHRYLEPGAYEVVLTVLDDGVPPRSARANLTVGVTHVQTLEGAVARPREGGTGRPVDWHAGFPVEGGARAVELVLEAVPGDLGPAEVEVRLLDATGAVVWAQAKELPPAGADFGTILAGAALAQPGAWTLEAASLRGAAALDGELRVRYGPGPAAGPAGEPSGS